MPEYYNDEQSDLLTKFYAGEPVSKTTIRLSDNHEFDIMNPDTWVFNVNNIANSLSNICRFLGHVPNHYSVAEHSVRVMQKVQLWGFGPLVQYLALHHDDVESIIGDIPSPQKRLFSIDGESFKDFEETLEFALFGSMGLTDAVLESWSVIKEADLAVYLDERDERETLGRVGDVLTPAEAKDRYLGAHYSLRAQLGTSVEPF